ncbi:dynein light chain Tctex-type 5-A [Nematostella vectensis]|uniref:dynein light chain Tctex-type 5-A n=1 Tax=Nematostella vectensis TaxID=45351 RepID=UPI0020778066|nr:dynein light chain Tctex-type 5-A [Nematostella vectensis]
MSKQAVKFPNLGGASIHQMVIALSAARKIKQFSTSLINYRRRNADKGSYEVTFTDDPVLYGDDALKAPKTSRERQLTVGTPLYEFDLDDSPPNTYRLEPGKQFEVTVVQRIMREVFEEEIKDLEYDAEKCAPLCKRLSDVVKARVKGLQYPRYKIIALVYVGQKEGQDVRITSRCVWDTRFDNCAQYAYEGLHDTYAVGMVYGIYQE